MEYFLQQLINGITLGSIYGLIAIGYTMVYGIIGMINFAHGDVFMVGSIVAFILILAFGVTGGSGTFMLILALAIIVVIAMIISSAYNWSIERFAYKPLRGSFRLAPLISAIGMSIVLQEFVRVAQEGRPKPIHPIILGGYEIAERATASGEFIVRYLKHADYHHSFHPRVDGGFHHAHSAHNAWPGPALVRAGHEDGSASWH